MPEQGSASAGLEHQRTPAPAAAPAGGPGFFAKTWCVAWREFKATALTKAFIIAAVAVPVLMIGLAVLGPILFNPKPPPLTGTIAIVDPDGHLATAAVIEFDPENVRRIIRSNALARDEQPSGLTDVGTSPDLTELSRNPRSMSAVTREFDINLALDPSHPPADLESLKARLAQGDLLAIVTTAEPPPPQAQPDQPSTTTAPAAPSIKLYVPSGMNVKHTGLIEDLVKASAGRARIVSRGLDVQTIRELARSPSPQTVRVSKDGQEKTEDIKVKIVKMMTPMAFMMLIWIGAFVSANYLLTTTIEEKSNKVMEVLLSAVSPLQLMAGKIIGQALVGLVMVGMYLAMGLVALAVMANADLIEWRDLVYFVIYYIMAYFMIASIMAAIGSAVNELREAQSLMTPAMIALIIPLMLWLPISDSPNSMLATVTSFIPPLIPFVMVLRVTGGEPVPFWQIAASIIVGYASMFAMIWMAAKIFRVGVLMYGKPPSPIELMRWLRYR